MPTDNYNRAASETVGGSWVEVEEAPAAGSFTIGDEALPEHHANVLRVHARRGTNSVTPARGFMYYNQTWLDDQSSKALFFHSFILPFEHGRAPGGLAVRINSCQPWDKPIGYGIIMDPAPSAGGFTLGKLYLLRYDEGVEVELGTSDGANVKKLDTLEVKVVATTLSVLRTKGTNWPALEQGGIDTLITVVDTTYANGKVGYIQNSDGSTNFTNPPFPCFQEWDDWVGTDLSGITTGGSCGSAMADPAAPEATYGTHDFPTYHGPTLHETGMHVLRRI